jgi:hypothetical protein
MQFPATGPTAGLTGGQILSIYIQGGGERTKCNELTSQIEGEKPSLCSRIPFKALLKDFIFCPKKEGNGISGSLQTFWSPTDLKGR